MIAKPRGGAIVDAPLPPMIFPPRFACSLRRWLVASLLGGAVCVHGAPPPAATGETLTTAAQVRALSEPEARRGIPVHLRGIFMGDADPQGIAFVMQDETDGIYVQAPANLLVGIGRGDQLDIEGVTDPGGFAPYVVAQTLRRTGHAPIPAPAPVTLDDLNAGQMDAKWVEIGGIVRSVEPKAPTDAAPPPPGTRYSAPANAAATRNEPSVKMELASGSARVVVQVDRALAPEQYVDAEVRLQGLCFNLHNDHRQFVRPFVQVPRELGVVIVTPAPADPFGSPPRPIAGLLQFDQLSGRRGHRVHVRGVVIHHEPGVALWIRDRDHSLRVETTQSAPVVPGDEVDVVGFPAMGDYTAILQDAVFRKSSFVGAPPPHVVADTRSAVKNDSDLVQLEGQVTEVRRYPDNVALMVDWDHKSIRAEMHLPDKAPIPGDWLPGSIVRVAGICSVVTEGKGPLGGFWEPHSFQLLLRSPADVVVIRPAPWWNAQRTAWVLSGFLALALGAVAAVMYASRRRLQDQEHRRAMAETEFTAILSERNRVAREIHDTLSQSLGAISVQLELARTHAADISAPARNHLGAAHKLARAALAEARESIWNMRSQVLETCDLGEALEGILLRLTEGTGITPRMRVEGDRRRLPPVTENNLLRIGQEAITNASKHAQPTRIDVTLTFDGRTVRLAVEDDGKGFVVDGARSDEHRRFGLVGIKERAKLLGGTVEIVSAPGQGTKIVVTAKV